MPSRWKLSNRVTSFQKVFFSPWQSLSNSQFVIWQSLDHPSFNPYSLAGSIFRYIPVRYLIFLLLYIGEVIVYGVRSMFNILLVCMTNYTATDSANDTSDECKVTSNLNQSLPHGQPMVSPVSGKICSPRIFVPPGINIREYLEYLFPKHAHRFKGLTNLILLDWKK